MSFITRSSFRCSMLSCCTLHPTPDSIPGDFGFPNPSCISRQSLYASPGSSDPDFTSCVFPFYDWVESGAPSWYHTSCINALKKPWPDIQCHCSRTDLINPPFSLWHSNFSLLFLLFQHLLIFNILSVTYTCIFNCCFKPFQLQHSLDMIQTGKSCFRGIIFH